MDESIPDPRREALARLEAAVTLLTRAEQGRIEYPVAVPGAAKLIDQAIAWLR